MTARKKILLKFVLLALFSLTVCPPTQLHASAVTPIGVLSFDSFQDGLNAVSVWNLTGDPATGGFALPPDFPIYTPLTFLASSITVFQASSSQIFFLGDLGPGFYTPPELVFSNLLNISSIALTATLDTSQLTRADGTNFSTATDLTVYLTPSSGSYLNPGDLSVISAVQTSAVQTPEPRSGLILCAALLLLIARCRLRRFQTGMSSTPL
jgi:hypothetical protein